MGPTRASPVNQTELELSMEKGTLVVRELNDGKWLIEIIRISPGGYRYSSSLYMSKEEAIAIKPQLPDAQAKELAE